MSDASSTQPLPHNHHHHRELKIENTAGWGVSWTGSIKVVLMVCFRTGKVTIVLDYRFDWSPFLQVVHSTTKGLAKYVRYYNRDRYNFG